MNDIAKRDEGLAMLRDNLAQQVELTKQAREEFVTALTSGQVYMPPPPRTRAQFAAKVNALMYNGAEHMEKGSQHHFGKQEMRELADWIYGTQLPLGEDEKIKGTYR